MPQFSCVERGAIVKLFYEAPKNRKGKADLTVVRQQFRQKFGKDAPDDKAIKSIVKKFETTGNTANLNKQKSGRHKSVLTAENTVLVKRYARQHPTSSTRAMSQTLQISRRSIQRVLHEDHLYPYKIQLFQHLTADDMVKRVEFCEKFLQLNVNNPAFLSNVWFSDEAHFYIKGYVNKQNMRFWGREQPRLFFRTKPLHPQYVTVWIAISCKGICGPYFFEDNAGARETVNQERYLNMLNRFFYQHLQDHNMDATTQWFQQDGATSHTTRAVLQSLSTIFEERIISMKTAFPWPARSPDLSVLDFWVWGMLKDNIFRDAVPNTIQDLKQCIVNEVRKIKIHQISAAFRNLVKRLEECVANGGAHVRNTFHHQHVVHIN